MARPASGIDCLADARASRDNAKTAEELRLALAVLPVAVKLVIA